MANPGAFERTMQGVRNLKAASIHTHTNTTINARNRHSLLALIDALAEMGQEYLSMNMVIRTGGAVGVPDEAAVAALNLLERRGQCYRERRGEREFYVFPGLKPSKVTRRWAACGGLSANILGGYASVSISSACLSLACFLIVSATFSRQGFAPSTSSGFLLDSPRDPAGD